MRLRSPVARHLLTVIAMLQMAMPAVASIAAGWLRNGSTVAAVVHAEDHTQANCVAVRTDQCVLCRIVARCSACSGMPSGTHVRRDGALEWHAGCPFIVMQHGTANSRPRAPPIA